MRLLTPPFDILTSVRFFWAGKQIYHLHLQQVCLIKLVVRQLIKLALDDRFWLYIWLGYIYIAVIDVGGGANCELYCEIAQCIVFVRH